MINYINGSNILSIYIIDGNHIIVFEYNKNKFNCDLSFYNFLMSFGEPINGYSSIQSNGVCDMESYNIVYNSVIAELNIYYEDGVEEGITIDTWFTINDEVVPVSFHDQLCGGNVSNKTIYNLVIACMNDHLLASAFDSFGI